MPRTGKKKRVLKMPQNSHFISRGTETEYGINMKVEEYECIRLIDYMAYRVRKADGSKQSDGADAVCRST